MDDSEALIAFQPCNRIDGEVSAGAVRTHLRDALQACTCRTIRARRLNVHSTERLSHTALRQFAAETPHLRACSCIPRDVRGVTILYSCETCLHRADDEVRTQEVSRLPLRVLAVLRCSQSNGAAFSEVHPSIRTYTSPRRAGGAAEPDPNRHNQVRAYGISRHVPTVLRTVPVA
jgi:hypothetical protein